MPGIDDVIHGGLPVLIGIVLWAAVVYATAHAAFDGFIGIELRRRYQAWFRHRTAPSQRAAWELRAGRKWSPQAAAGDPMAATPTLTDEDRAERLAGLRAKWFTMLVYRGIAFGLECAFCHRFWSATIWWFAVGIDWNSPSILAPWLSTCLCQATLATGVGRLLRVAGPNQNAPTSPCGR